MPFDVYILTEGNISTLVAEVTAVSFEDVENFDNANYRDANDVQLHTDTALQVKDKTATTPPTVAATGEIQVATFLDSNMMTSSYAGDIGIRDISTATTITGTPPNETTGIEITKTDTTTPYLQVTAEEFHPNDHYMMLDDIKAHIAPRNEMKKRTRLILTTVSTGEYFFWADQIIGTSSSEFHFVN